MDEIKKALEPFAEVASWMERGREIDRTMTFYFDLHGKGSGTSTCIVLEAEDFERARRALQRAK